MGMNFSVVFRMKRNFLLSKWWFVNKVKVVFFEGRVILLPST